LIRRDCPIGSVRKLRASFRDSFLESSGKVEESTIIASLISFFLVVGEKDCRVVGDAGGLGKQAPLSLSTARLSSLSNNVNSIHNESERVSLANAGPSFSR
jgi:hypothetical protein